MLPQKKVMPLNTFLQPKYYDVDNMHNTKIPHKNKLLHLFHKNACSLNKNFDDLQHLLICAKKKKKKIDIIAISAAIIASHICLLNFLYNF